jgi:hypothetical protein
MAAAPSEAIRAEPNLSGVTVRLNLLEERCDRHEAEISMDLARPGRPESRPLNVLQARLVRLAMTLQSEQLYRQGRKCCPVSGTSNGRALPVFRVRFASVGRKLLPPQLPGNCTIFQDLRRSRKPARAVPTQLYCFFRTREIFTEYPRMPVAYSTVGIVNSSSTSDGWWNEKESCAIMSKR